MLSPKLCTQPLKGILDFPPNFLERYNAVKMIIDQVAEQNGYREYDVPILESWETFAVKSAEEILEEQSYHFTDRGGRKVILRPEITPSLARLVAKEIKQLPQPLRWFTVGRCYRYERPQKGRLREFRQLNFDILGKKHYLYDLEILRIIKHLMDAFSIPPNKYVIHYNHRGLVNHWLNQEGFTLEQARDFLTLVDRRNKLTPEGFTLKSKELFPSQLQESVEKYFTMTSLSDLLPPSHELPETFSNILYLEESLLKVNHSCLDRRAFFSPATVRGFDYYTGLVFEVFAKSGDIHRSLFGGGRYDNLIGNYLNQSVSGIGFGMGLDIFILFLESIKCLPINPSTKTGYYIAPLAPLDEKVIPYSLEIGEALIHRGFRVENAPVQKISKHFNRVNGFSENTAFSGIILIGEDEFKNRSFTLKDLKSGEQKTLPFAEENLPKG